MPKTRAAMLQNATVLTFHQRESAQHRKLLAPVGLWGTSTGRKGQAHEEAQKGQRVSSWYSI